MPPDEAKSEAILRAALDLFVEKGFYGTPVPELAERAGVAAGTIYRAFANKEAVVNALYKRCKSMVATQLVDRFPIDAPPREQFRLVWERMTQFALTHPQELSFLELHHHRSYLDEENRALESNMHQFGEMVVRRAQEAQAVKAIHPAILIELSNGAFLGVFRGAIEGRLPMTRETFMAAEQCCWEAIRA